jgi:hypothetical protein
MMVSELIAQLLKQHQASEALAVNGNEQFRIVAVTTEGVYGVAVELEPLNEAGI